MAEELPGISKSFRMAGQTEPRHMRNLGQDLQWLEMEKSGWHSDKYKTIGLQSMAQEQSLGAARGG